MMKSIFLSLLALLLLVTTAQAEQHGQVCWISDGDTITVDGVGVVRLIGIDCPEKEASDRDWKYIRLGSSDWRQLREVARSAHHRTIELCKDKRVRLETGKDRYDRYDRLLAYVWLPDGRMLNQLLLEEGLAIVYRRFDFSKKEAFLRREKHARRKKIGMWDNYQDRSVSARRDSNLNDTALRVTLNCTDPLN
ncbi:MAG: thermonuclease family protein [Desulfuromonas sp.]|nr:thermonuclease family protein [Desulfuromonas sp.]